jgi:hypothetical protein
MSGTSFRIAVAATASLAALAIAPSAQGLPSSSSSSSSTTASLASPRYQHRAALAARWQASQLTQGRIHNGQFDFDDWGLTVDTGLMLAAEGSHPAQLARLTKAVRNHYTDYTGTGAAKYAGAVAKTLVFVKVTRHNSRTFGGVNVRAELMNRIAKSGRLSDKGTADSSNVISQAYGVIGLSRTGGVPQRVVDYLLKQRCAAGYFRLQEVPHTACRRSTDSPDVDATALALQALLSARHHGATVSRKAITGTAAWLVSAQRANGSFGGGSTTGKSNSNSTGLAANALAATGHRAARMRAADWVARLQILRAKAASGPARTDIGAVAYRPPALREALETGIGVKKRDQFRRATPQAYFALAPAPLNDLLAPK